ncbi:MAG: hypothetical protein PHD61_09590 [Bacteroidales bacterium]|nr:hypothetical protein [Lentimicrobiaceae bacterium]MDD5695538.1 hypothetical protein [Bacteroidales bacterium]
MRGHKGCIYEQRVDDYLTYYEVFIIKIRSERRIGTTVIEGGEWFPPDEAWGEWAWTFQNYEDALWRFQELEDGKKRLDFTYRGSSKRIYDE